MATYYLWSGAGGSASGADWTNAFLTLTAALAAATTSGDVIKVHKTHTDIIAADITYTLGANLSIICVDKDSSDALAVMDGSTGYIGHTTSNFSITMAGAFKLYSYGVCWLVSGSSSDNLNMAATSGMQAEYESCKIWLQNTATSSRIRLNTATDRVESYVKLTNCSFKFGSTSQAITSGHEVVIIGGSVDSGGSAPSTLFASFNRGLPKLFVYGFDMSHISGTIVAFTTQVTLNFVFMNCKLHASATRVSRGSLVNRSSGEVWFIDCNSGDVHYGFEHYNIFGETISIGQEVGGAIYANTGATYDGTNKYVWKIVTTSLASFAWPYVSPPLQKYNSTLSAITPYLEILRDGSSTAYDNDEVWSEWLYKGTSAVVTTTLNASDKALPMATPAAQTSSSLGASDWTGENATAWFGKLAPSASITPAEIGTLSVNVSVGLASATVYVDPQIRT